MRRTTRKVKAKGKAKRSVPRKVVKREAARGQLEKRLAEALEQQAATSEILRVIAGSPTDVQPVFDTIAQSARRLCEGEFCHVFRFDGERLDFVAHDGLTPEGAEALRRAVSIAPDRGSAAGRAVLEAGVAHVPDVDADPEYTMGAVARVINFRSVVAVPMMREGAAIGAVAVARSQVGHFPERQTELLKIFADQAVIAIENARLFRELEARNGELTEALAQQTATSEVLKVISRSAFDLQPVLESVIESATRLCGAARGHIFRFDGTVLRYAAACGAWPGFQEYLEQNPVRPGAGSVAGRAASERRPIHVHDVLAESGYEYGGLLSQQDYRTVLAVPMLRDDVLLGVIVILKSNVGPFTDGQVELVSTFADQAVIAIENVRLFQALEARNRDLTETLEQQTATSEILRVISSCPTDVQPVFDTIVRSARGLCEAESAAVMTYDGELIQIKSLDNSDPERAEALRRAYPIPANRGHAAGRAILAGRPVHIPDVREDPEYALDALRDAVGLRTVLSVPMVRDGSPIGAITLQRWVSARPFSDNQIALLQTFADQAVIAIENVRLFTELDARNRELGVALEQQTATSELLKVIGRSTFDLQPVFETLAENAVRLCEAERAFIFRYDGQLLRVVATHNASPELRAFVEQNPIAPGRHTGTARAALERRTIHIIDAQTDPDYTYGARQIDPIRTVLTIPMLRADELLGVLLMYRYEVRAFTDSQIALLQTFADQAAIAIENVRLFRELESRNRDLTETLEQQTATGEILRVISSSPTDVQPVFDAIVESAVHLCQAMAGALLRFDGEMLHPGAVRGPGREQILRAWANFFPYRPGPEVAIGRAVLERRVIHIEDVLSAPANPLREATQRAGGYRAFLAVPMLRDDSVVGVIACWREEAGALSDRQISVLQTFADQAVIAIENVRLFTELDARNRELGVALEQQTATSELLKVIGRSTFDLQPVFETLAENAVRLSGAERGYIYRFDGHLLRLVVSHNASAEFRAFVEQNPFGPGRENCAGRAALERRTVHIHDVRADPEYTYGSREVDPYRTILGIPMLRGDELLGVIIVYRHEVRPFTDSQIALLETFADQAAIAIENARLLNELQARTAQLSRSVQELRALGEVSRAVSSTLDLETVLATIVSRAAQLSGSDQGIVYEFEEATQTFHQRATHQITPEYLEALRAAPIRLGEGAMGRAGVIREPVQVADIQAEWQLVAPQVRTFLDREGMRSLLAVPLVREDRLLGGLVILRRVRGAFSPEVVATLQSFATQSVLAIHNAGLFREIQRQKQYSEALVETSPVAIATLDLQGVVVGWNPGAEKLFGYTQGEALGRALDDLVATTPEIREEVRGGIGQGLRGERIRAITRRTRKDGTLVDVEISAMPVAVEGAQVGFIGIYHDITELLQARREAEAANEAKSAFLATMSHEIRTPMNAVIGMSGLLLNTALSDEQREYAEIVRQSGDALLTVINDILDFSKIEAGKLELESQPFDVRECVESALDLVATRAAEKGIDLAYLIGDGTPAAVVGDVTRLRQILLNLLSNAVKFTEEGEVVLSVSARRVDDQTPSELTFSVRDTGIGIPPDRVDRLFQSFSQVDASTTRRFGGTGLGLVISQRLTELMGGRIGVTSEVGTGSEFRFTIRAPAAHVPVPTRRDLSGVQPSLRGKRVLVVDDNATNRRILTAHFDAWGMPSRASASPVEALAWVRAGETFDIGILDMHMPEMDGVTLARAIREHVPADALPLVLFTSLGRREARAESEGFAAYLHKPIKPSQLFDALVSVLAERPVHVAPRGAARSDLDPDMARRHPLRILLAEDNVVNQKVALRLLGQMGYRADVAGNGLEAIEAVERQTYDVVLMDVQMPELDGFEASREINRRWPGGRHPRIVAMTANAMQGDRELCEAAGMDDYVAKPIRVEELVAALERCARRPEAGGRGGSAADAGATKRPPSALAGVALQEPPGEAPRMPGAAEAPDAAAAIDRKTLDRLTATMGAAFVAELIDTFLADGLELLAALRRGFAGGDIDAFRRAAHSLKSNSETLGATGLAALARELETMARGGSLDGAGERLDPLARAYESAARALGEHRHGRPA